MNRLQRRSVRMTRAFSWALPTVTDIFAHDGKLFIRYDWQSGLLERAAHTLERPAQASRPRIARTIIDAVRQNADAGEHHIVERHAPSERAVDVQGEALDQGGRSVAHVHNLILRLA